MSRRLHGGEFIEASRRSTTSQVTPARSRRLHGGEFIEADTSKTTPSRSPRLAASTAASSSRPERACVVADDEDAGLAASTGRVHRGRRIPRPSVLDDLGLAASTAASSSRPPNPPGRLSTRARVSPPPRRRVHRGFERVADAERIAAPSRRLHGGEFIEARSATYRASASSGCLAASTAASSSRLRNAVATHARVANVSPPPRRRVHRGALQAVSPPPRRRVHRGAQQDRGRALRR